MKLLIALALFAAAANAAAPFAYVGCYKDQGNRDLAVNKAYGNGGMTAALCANMCAGYKYFSTQYAGECFCSNNWQKPGKYGEDAQGCTMKCTGNQNEMCGAGWRNSVYQMNPKCPLRDEVEGEMKQLRDENAIEAANALSVKNDRTNKLQAAVAAELAAQKFLAESKAERIARTNEHAVCVGQENALKLERDTLDKTTETEIKLIKKLIVAVRDFQEKHGKNPTKHDVQLNKAKLRDTTAAEIETALDGNFEDAEQIVEILNGLIARLQRELGELNQKYAAKIAECKTRLSKKNAAIAKEEGAEKDLALKVAAREAAQAELARVTSIYNNILNTQEQQNAAMVSAKQALDKLTCHHGHLPNDKHKCRAFEYVDEALNQKFVTLKQQREAFDSKLNKMNAARAFRDQKIQERKAAEAHLASMLAHERTCYAEKKTEQEELAAFKTRTNKLLALIELLKKRVDCVRAVKLGGDMPQGCENLADLENSEEGQELIQALRAHKELDDVDAILDKIAKAMKNEYETFEKKVNRITCDHRIAARKAAQQLLAKKKAELAQAEEELRVATANHDGAKALLIKTQTVLNAEYVHMKHIRAKLVYVSKKEGCNFQVPDMASHQDFRPAGMMKMIQVEDHVATEEEEMAQAEQLFM